MVLHLYSTIIVLWYDQYTFGTRSGNSPDLPAELGRGPDSENCGCGGMEINEPRLDGRFPALGSGVRGILGREPNACLYSGGLLDQGLSKNKTFKNKLVFFSLFKIDKWEF